MSRNISAQANAHAHGPLNRPLVVGLCLLAFVTMLTYAVANSVAQALFLSRLGSAALPWMWLGVAGVTALVTAWLGTMSQRLDVVTLFVRSSWVSAITLILVLVAAGLGHPASIWGLYLWKDIYIIVLVELFWTFSNVAFGVTQASRTYGLFCAAGSLGSILGNVALGPLSAHMGTLAVLWSLLPMLLGIGWGCRALAAGVPLPKPVGSASASGGWHMTVGFNAVRHSPYLMWLMVLVALAQGVLTLVDYQFSFSVETAFSSDVERASAIGYMYATINAVSFVLQLLTGKWLLVAGLSRTFLVLPVALGAGLMWAVWAPGLWAWALCQLIGKSLDYSLFRAAKELLYIPLNYIEKTQGKAAIDILTYRLAKGCASLVLLALGSLSLAVALVGPITLVLSCGWFVTAKVILRRHRAVLAARAAPARGSINA